MNLIENQLINSILLTERNKKLLIILVWHYLGKEYSSGTTFLFNLIDWLIDFNCMPACIELLYG